MTVISSVNACLSRSVFPVVPFSRTMSKAIIAPSVLASDLSNLTAECKRMISEGADWLHMGSSVVRVYSFHTSLMSIVDRRHGWVSHILLFPWSLLDHSALALQTLCAQHHHGSAHPHVRQEGRPSDLYGLPHDGCRSDQGASLCRSSDTNDGDADAPGTARVVGAGSR